MNAGSTCDSGDSHFNSERSSDPRGDLLRQLRGQLGRSGAMTMTDEESTFSSGSAAIDRLLPGGGLRHGMLVEWLAELPGCGAATLALVAAREACRAGGVLVVVDRAQTFYPPAAVGWGVDPARLIVVRPRTMRDEIWAAVQALRSPVVAAVWTMIDRLDSRNFRRLQLAAEAGRTLGVLVRRASARGQPSWADVRLEVAKAEGGRGRGEGKKQVASSFLPPSAFHPRPLSVSVLHLRGGRAGGSVLVEIDEAAHDVREVAGAVSDRLSAVGQNVRPRADSQQPRAFSHDTHPLPVVAELADPAAGAHSARA
jgi:protein ImuA